MLGNEMRSIVLADPTAGPPTSPIEARGRLLVRRSLIWHRYTVEAELPSTSAAASPLGGSLPQAGCFAD